MSPIDIVPVGHHKHFEDSHYMDETVMGSMGIIENKNAYHTGDSEIPTKDGSMSSLRHLKPPARGGHRVVRDGIHNHIQHQSLDECISQQK